MNTPSQVTGEIRPNPTTPTAATQTINRFYPPTGKAVLPALLDSIGKIQVIGYTEVNERPIYNVDAEALFTISMQTESVLALMEGSLGAIGQLFQEIGSLENTDITPSTLGTIGWLLENLAGTIPVLNKLKEEFDSGNPAFARDETS